MKYLIVEPKVKSKAPNIALMKFAKLFEMNGDEYIYVKGCVDLDDRDFTPNVILMSMIFTYFSKRYEKTIDYYLKKYPNVKIKVGGVFPTLLPDWFNKQKWTGNSFFGTKDIIKVHKGMYHEIEDIPPKYNVDILYEDDIAIHSALDTIVLYASRGCTNKCGYCAVPKLEGPMRSFNSIKGMLTSAKESMPNARTVVLYDNNFTEHEYFDDIVDELVEFGLPVDIHGLHVESFTEHQAKRFAELKWGSQSEGGNAYLRFSFDKMEYADDIKRALELVLKYNIKAQFFAYMLFNFTDKPEDFWWRVIKAQEIVDELNCNMVLFPQRYEPFKSLKRNSYIGKYWTEEMVKGLVRIYTTKLKGWLRINQYGAIYKYIGNDLSEFLDNIKGEPSPSPTGL